MAAHSAKKKRFSFSTRIMRSLLVFVGLFILFAGIQFEIFVHQRRTVGRDKLERWAGEIAKELKYSDKWDLASFRNADYEANHYYVTDRDGLIIVVGGFLPELQLRVRLEGQTPGFKTFTVPETGESWRIFVKPVKGGVVFLGVTPPDNITNVDARLEKNAVQFGASLAAALQVNIHDVDGALDCAIIDDTGLVRYFLGGIPLKLVPGRNFPVDDLHEMKSSAGTTWGVLSKPFRDSSGREVGYITVSDELIPGPWKLWTTNFLASATLSLIGTFVSGPLLRRRIPPEKLLASALRTGESAKVEFKEALRWDQWQGSQDVRGAPPDQKKKLLELRNIAEAIAVKNIAAFLNNLEGGTLFIGIADDKRIMGLDRDYETFARPGQERGRDKDRDRFQLHVRSILASRIDSDLVRQCVEIGIVNVEDKDVCVIHVSPSPSAVYISEEKGKAFYVRDGASTVALNIEQAVAYIERRWPKALWPRLRSSIGL